MQSCGSYELLIIITSPYQLLLKQVIGNEQYTYQNMCNISHTFMTKKLFLYVQQLLEITPVLAMTCVLKALQHLFGHHYTLKSFVYKMILNLN